MTIGPWDTKKLERANDERGTKGRGNADRGHVDFITIRGVPYKVLVNVLPKDPVVLDELKVTPSKRYRNQETVSQAKKALAQSKAGKRVPEGDIALLQQRLLTIERQKELVGRDSEGRQLAEALGDVRRSNLVNNALDVLAKAKKGGRLADRSIETLQKQLMGMEHQDQVAGRESEGKQLSDALGEVRRSQLVAEATSMLARSKRGRIKARDIDKLQQRLLGMGRQDELFGRESEGRQLAEALGDVRRTQLVAEAKDVIAQAKRGRQFSNAHIIKLQQLLSAMERNDELRGNESEGFDLAVALAELRH
jgi:hypothetical protein